MDLFGLGGRIFRARLKRELPRWRADAIISSSSEKTLAARYQLDEEGVSVATAAIYLLGVLLIGGGVISLVAWNWDALGRFAKLSLIGSAMIVAHGSGYWLWKISGRMPKLGHALMLLGTLIFGANIGLVAQIFHIHTGPSSGLAAWAIGAAVAAWALPSVPHGVLAAAISAVWAPVFFEEHRTLYVLAPFMVSVPSFLLAWRKLPEPERHLPPREMRWFSTQGLRLALATPGVPMILLLQVLAGILLGISRESGVNTPFSYTFG